MRERFGQGTDARERLESSFIMNADVSGLGVEASVAHKLKEMGYGILVIETARDPRGNIIEDTVAIHGDERASVAFWEVLGTPEISALDLLSEPNEKKERELVNKLRETVWDEDTQARLRAKLYQSAANEWMKIYEGGDGNEEALARARINEKRATTILEGREILDDEGARNLAREVAERTTIGMR